MLAADTYAAMQRVQEDAAEELMANGLRLWREQGWPLEILAEAYARYAAALDQEIHPSHGHRPESETKS